jgi:tetratricopeptide (TPR) repeat protein
MKRGILYLQMKHNEKALEDFNTLCELAEGGPEGGGEEAPPQPQSIAKSYFYKAKALKKLNNCNDAVLYFEQVIRSCCDDQFLQSSALYEIAKIKIQQKDFYEAYYNLQRAAHYKLKQKKLINYKIFTEGVIFLMKRKTKTGIKLLSSLIERISESSSLTQQDYITPLVYIYRGYGHFVQDEFDKALKDYIKSNQIKKLNMSAHFNMVMCQGLKALEKKEYENAISFFTRAG